MPPEPGIPLCTLASACQATQSLSASSTRPAPEPLPTPLPRCPAVPLAIGGALPEGVQLRDDMPDAGLANVAGAWPRACPRAVAVFGLGGRPLRQRRCWDHAQMCRRSVQRCRLTGAPRPAAAPSPCAATVFNLMGYEVRAFRHCFGGSDSGCL